MSPKPKVERFSDAFAPAPPVQGDYVRTFDLLGKDLEVIDAENLVGNYGQYLRITARHPGEAESFSFACGAKAVVRKITVAKEQKMLPLVGKLVQVGRALDIQ